MEYYFENTTNVTNSGWTTSPTWTDTGLTTGTPYDYQVKARDGLPNQNETAYSATATGTPQADTTPPDPDPMTFLVAPFTGTVSGLF